MKLVKSLGDSLEDEAAVPLVELHVRQQGVVEELHQIDSVHVLHQNVAHIDVLAILHLPHSFLLEFVYFRDFLHVELGKQVLLIILRLDELRLLLLAVLVEFHRHLHAVLLDELDHCDSSHPDRLQYLVAITLRALCLELQFLNLLCYL